jgi:hypothetical protein
MEFDARIKEPDKVGWSCKVILPDGDTLELKFRDFANIPGRISLDNVADQTSQLWGSLDWGLIEPKHWPVNDSEMSGLNLFRQLPMAVVMKIHRAWQREAGVSLGESEDSKDSSESTETS